jgi:aromatic-L-amino-acid decarboxylase
MSAHTGFTWHPEPGLLDFRDQSTAQPLLEELGRTTWAAALDWLYAYALIRPTGPEDYEELRRVYFGPSAVPGDLPHDPARFSEVLAEFGRRIAPHLYNAQHPRSFSYFTPAALPASIAGEVLAQWTNQSVDVWQAAPGAALVEEEVTRWLCEVIGFPDAAWGVLTSGGVMSNIMALAIARDLHLGRSRSSAPRGSRLEDARVYTSDQAHFSIGRALDLLGFPAETLRILPSDDAFRLRGDVVAEAITVDRRAGLTPFAIAATCGTTNTGSVDKIGELADLAEEQDVWLHVDAAYGGGVRLSRRDAIRAPHLERAHTVTVDPHKWFFQAFDIGGLVVRDQAYLRETFHRAPEYYRHSAGNEAPLDWYQYSIEGTRRFRALKLWFSWKHLGTAGLGRLVEMTNDVAAYLAARCREEPDFEVLPEEPQLSVVCFRHLPKQLDPALLDRYQDALQHLLTTSGIAWVSTTRLRGRTFLRAGVVNYLSTARDVDVTLETLRSLSDPAIELVKGP